MKDIEKMNKVIECIPNFSEGRDHSKINQIAESIRSVENVKLLHIDIGYDTNRTVMTFVGDPDGVIEAAYRAIKTAQRLIDMSVQTGEHPRIGATDVCPLVAIKNVSTEEIINYSNTLGFRVGSELKIPVFMYEHSARLRNRKNLAQIRKGQYERMKEKITHDQWIPDFGPGFLPDRSGATVIGARDFLIAFNVSLNTTDIKKAQKISARLRENGPYKSELTLFKEKEKVYKIKGLKAIGWYLPSYKCVQISMNVTDINEGKLFEVFEACSQTSKDENVEILYSELIGLAPKKSFIEAGLKYKDKIKLKKNMEELELINLAADMIKLNNFVPQERILEYAMNNT